MSTLRLNGQVVTLNGVPVTLNGPDPASDTPRLAFAAREPRRGTIRNDAARRGLILNPGRKGTLLELTP